MKLNDAIFGFLLIVLGAVVLGIVQGYPKIPGQQVGPALFPGLLAVGLCIGGVMLVVRGWAVRHEGPWVVPGEWMRMPHHVLAFVLVLASVVFYMLVSERLGFLPTAAISLTALFYALRVPLPKAILVAVITSLVVHFAFYKLLRVPLPWGVLMDVAW
jgi:putative tricarboxylic transport membrane protein